MMFCDKTFEYVLRICIAYVDVEVVPVSLHFDEKVVNCFCTGKKPIYMHSRVNVFIWKKQNFKFLKI